MGIWYATLEDLRGAFDVAETPRNDPQLYRALESGARSIDGSRQGLGLLGRRFYPEVATRYFDWPGSRAGRDNSKLSLAEHELIAATSVVAGGITLDPAAYRLQPENDGPPYDEIHLNRDVYSTWPTSGTGQRTIAVAGTWGFNLDSAPAGALAEALDASETGVNVTDSNAIGIGSLITCQSERMLCTAKAMLTTGQTLQTPLTASMADQSVTVTDGTAFNIGETLLLDSERMRIRDIAANTLVVWRAHDGSTLATHAASTIYAPRTLTVQRGVLGTTAATHADTTALTVQVYPAPVNVLNVAEAMYRVQQELGAWGRSMGSADNEATLAAYGLSNLREDAVAAYGRPKVFAVV
jgi:hypothetical protein